MKKSLIFLFFVMMFMSCKTPMTKLIKDGNLAEITQRVNDGEDPNEIGCDTPLIVASNRGNLELINLLLDKGANPNLRSNECDYNASYARFKMGTRSALGEAKTLEIAKLLVSKGANLNLGNYKEYLYTTALYSPPLREHIVAERFDIANFLVDSGANLNLYTDEGKNLFLLVLNNDKNRKTAEAIRLKSKIISKGGRELDLAKYKSKSLQEVKSYTHNTFGGSTSMPIQFRAPLLANPLKFSALTIHSGDGKYYHYSEFTEDETKMNLHEWYIIRGSQVSKKK